MNAEKVTDKSSRGIEHRKTESNAGKKGKNIVFAKAADKDPGIQNLERWENSKLAFLKKKKPNLQQGSTEQ